MSDYLTTKTNMMFPTIGTIRKGGPKQTREKNGKTYEVVGKDLDARFRVVFSAGQEKARDIFVKEYGGLEVEVIRAQVPFARVDQSYMAYNEAYNAGMMLAQADASRYIRLRDPMTNEYIVRDGEPFKRFTPGDVIEYDRNGRHMVIPIRPYIRWKLWLPVFFPRLCTMELKSTSYYDSLNLDGQLAAIQGLADILNHGNAAGIPLIIYRMPTEISQTKSEGGATRRVKWLINVEPDPVWVENAMARMKKLAWGEPPTPLPALTRGTDEPKQMVVNIPDLDKIEDQEPLEFTDEVIAVARQVKTPKGNLLGDLKADQLQAIIDSVDSLDSAGKAGAEEYRLRDAADIVLASLQP